MLLTRKKFSGHRATTGHHLLKHAPILIFMLLSAYFLNFFVNSLLGRWLGSEYYGSFSYVKSIIALAAFLLLFGRNYSVMKFIPEYFSKQAWGFFHGYIKTDTLIVGAILLSTLIILGVVFPIIFIPTLKGHLANASHFLRDVFPFLYFLWIIPLYAMILYLQKYLRALKKIYWATLSFNFLKPIIFLAVILTFFTLYKFINIYQAFYALGISSILTVIAQALLAFIYTPSKSFQVKPEFEKKKWRATSNQLFLSNIMLMLISNVIVILLKVFGHHSADIGVFSAIMTITSVFSTLFNAVLAIITPMISPLMESGDKEKIQSLLNTGNIIIICILTIVTGAICILRHKLLLFFGKDFLYGGDALVIMALGNLIVMSLNLPWYFIEYSGAPNLLLLPIITIVFLNLIVSSIFIHFFALYGAVLGLLLSQLILAIWQSVILEEHFGVHPFFFI